MSSKLCKDKLQLPQQKWKEIRARLVKFHDACCIFKGFREDGSDEHFVRWYLKYSKMFIGGIVASSIEELEMQLALRGF